MKMECLWGIFRGWGRRFRLPKPHKERGAKVVPDTALWAGNSSRGIFNEAVETSLWKCETAVRERVACGPLCGSSCPGWECYNPRESGSGI